MQAPASRCFSFTDTLGCSLLESWGNRKTSLSMWEFRVEHKESQFKEKEVGDYGSSGAGSGVAQV